LVWSWYICTEEEGQEDDKEEDKVEEVRRWRRRSRRRRRMRRRRRKRKRSDVGRVLVLDNPRATSSTFSSSPP
jgi:hypothetical protein